MSAAEQNVLGLDVAVDDAVGVGVRQGVRHLGGERDDLVHRQLLLPAQPAPQGLAIHERHDEIRRLAARAVVDGARVEDREDVGMLKAGRELDLAEKAGDSAGPAQLRPDDLDRHVAAVSQVLRQVDRRHAARADLALESVAFSERGHQALEGVGHEVEEFTG